MLWSLRLIVGLNALSSCLRVTCAISTDCLNGAQCPLFMTCAMWLGYSNPFDLECANILAAGLLKKINFQIFNIFKWHRKFLGVGFNQLQSFRVQRAKIATQQQKAFCVLLFNKCESAVTVQRDFRRE